MKSLLVDALREANGVSASDNGVPSPGVADEAEDGSVAATGAEHHELAIMENTGVAAPGERIAADVASTDEPDVSVASQGEHNETPIADDDVQAFDRANQAERRDEPAVVDPAMVLSSLKPDDIELAEDTGLASAATVDSDGHPPEASRIGPPGGDRLVAVARWSPLLCLLTLSAAAGSVVMYQTMTAQRPDFDLNVSAVSPPSEANDLGVTPAWQTLAESNVAAPDSDPPAAGGSDTPAVAPTNVSPEQAAPRIRQIAAARQPATADPYFDDLRRAYEAYRQRRFSDSEKMYRAILERDAFHAQALSGLAAVVQRGPNAVEAAALYERLLAIDPGSTAAAAALAALADTGNAESVESRLKVMLQRQPDNAAFHFALGLRMAMQSRWPEAFESFSHAARLNPHSADYSFNAAVSAQHLGRRDVARQLYATALDDLSAGSLVDLQTVQQQLNQLDKNPGVRP